MTQHATYRLLLATSAGEPTFLECPDPIEEGRTLKFPIEDRQSARVTAEMDAALDLITNRHRRTIVSVVGEGEDARYKSYLIITKA